jgi:hypothetical protein
MQSKLVDLQELEFKVLTSEENILRYVISSKTTDYLQTITNSFSVICLLLSRVGTRTPLTRLHHVSYIINTKDDYYGKDWGKAF